MTQCSGWTSSFATRCADKILISESIKLTYQDILVDTAMWDIQPMEIGDNLNPIKTHFLKN